MAVGDVVLPASSWPFVGGFQQSYVQTVDTSAGDRLDVIVMLHTDAPNARPPYKYGIVVG